MRHIILISGKDSLATAIVQTRRAPHLPYELVHNDTGWDLPETLEWIERVGQHFGRPILRLGDDLTEICNEKNCLPPGQQQALFEDDEPSDDLAVTSCGLLCGK